MTNPNDPLLSVSCLTVDFPGAGRYLRAVHGIDMQVERGKILGIVGESGSGKTSIGHALMGLSQERGARVGGQILFQGQPVPTSRASAWREIRGKQIAMVFQDPSTALNPLMRVGKQIGEVFRYHCSEMKPREIAANVLALMERVGIRDASSWVNAYPHQLSGGMQQRVVIAAAIALQPKLLIADEPTSSLDVTTQARILDLMRSLVEEQDMAMVFISHDLDVVSDMCDDVAVMKDGQFVETGSVDCVLTSAKHAYTQQLLAVRPMFGTGHAKLQEAGDG